MSRPLAMASRMKVLEKVDRRRMDYLHAVDKALLDFFAGARIYNHAEIVQNVLI